MNAVGGRASLNAVDDGGDSVVTENFRSRDRKERRREPSVIPHQGPDFSAN
jgi:hypothetical protein